jgi:hypothetical protein
VFAWSLEWAAEMQRDVDAAILEAFKKEGFDAR